MAEPEHLYIADKHFKLNKNSIHKGKNSQCFFGTDDKGNSSLIKKIPLPAQSDFDKLTDKLNKFYIQTNTIDGLCKTDRFQIIDDHLYVARPKIEGNTLKSPTKKLNRRQIIKLMINTLRTAGELHSKGIIHTDIKPANILLKDNNPATSFLIDIEQARLNKEGIIPSPKIPFSLLYSAPEQLLRRKNLMGSHSDIFSCGIVLYELLSKRPAFRHFNPEILMNLQISYPLQKTLNIPQELFRIIEKATHRMAFPKPLRKMKEADKLSILQEGINGRYSTCQEAIADLEEYLHSLQHKKSFFNFWR